MATPIEIYEAMVALIKTRIPGFEVRFKSESWSQRLVALLVFVFNPKYLTGFTTTLSPYVYFPRREFVTANPTSAYKVLAHEYVHLWDTKQRPLGFRVSYMMPQLLALLALGAVGAFWSRWFLLSLVFLLALAPWPSRGRTRAEMRGYAMSMAMNFWRHGSIDQGTKDYIAVHFTGWSYYRMCPNTRKVQVELDAWAAQISSGEILKGVDKQPFADIYALLQEKGVVAAGVSAHG
jgi:hypothetical protein